MTGLTKKGIETACRKAVRDGREARLWHDNPRGFGVRIKPTGVATFFVQYTSPITGRKTRHTIDQFGRLTLEEAVKEARKLLGRVARDEDPAREKKRARSEAKLKVRTVAELCKSYMRDAEVGLVTYRGRPKKASTLAIDRGRIDRHIVPLLGDRLVQDVVQKDVEAFFHAVRRGDTATVVRSGRPRGIAKVTGGTTTASRTVDLLGSLFSYALRHGLREDNPVAGFERPPTSRRDRILSPKEYGMLGAAMKELEAEGSNPVLIAAVRALALTGCRRAEIFALGCDRVDAHRQVLRFADSKGGQQLRPIGKAALEVLLGAETDFASRRRYEVGGKEMTSPYLFPGSRGNGGPLVGVKAFRKIIDRAGLKDVTIHTLRHSYASAALELGYSELTIAGLLGHRQHSVTSRYAHHVDRALVSAADRVSEHIENALAGSTRNTKVVQMTSARKAKR